LDYKIFFTIFATVFIAELGDKTQLATMLFAADKEVSKFTVLVGASLALIAATVISVLAGSIISQYISTKYLHYIAGVGFIAIGIWTFARV
jgi:putative Ca2+/H+ antiporter (TMEM165/GDT1 family)